VSPWVIAGAVLGAGALLYASTAAAAEEELTLVAEYGFPYWQCGVMIRHLKGPAGELWLWDIASLEDVEFGEEAMSVESWPEPSLHFGQSQTERFANEAALAWVDAHQSFVLSGGERGPLAERIEAFLAALTPLELDELLDIFGAIDPAIGPHIEALRVAPTDAVFLEHSAKIGALLESTDQDALQSDILAAIGWGNGLTLKGILDEAGVL
jgi:hypothetical protein